MPSGSKQWCQRLSLDGKRSDCGLGAYPFMGLAEVRRTERRSPRPATGRAGAVLRA